MFIHYKPQRNKKLAPKKIEEPKAEEVIFTFEEDIPVVEDYNKESSLNEINTFLATYEEEESLGEDY